MRKLLLAAATVLSVGSLAVASSSASAFAFDRSSSDHSRSHQSGSHQSGSRQSGASQSGGSVSRGWDNRGGYERGGYDRGGSSRNGYDFGDHRELSRGLGDHYENRWAYGYSEHHNAYPRAGGSPRGGSVNCADPRNVYYCGSPVSPPHGF